MTNFEKAFEETIGLEGNYSNNPKDPGGETKYGITKRDYPTLDIKNLTLAQAQEIYKRDFWDRMALDLVEDVDIACEIFDTGLNGGTVTAIRIAQRSCNALGYSIKVDGFMGHVTAAALNHLSVKDKDTLYVVLNCLQCARYVELTEKNEDLKTFFYGWVRNRVQLNPRRFA